MNMSDFHFGNNIYLNTLFTKHVHNIKFCPLIRLFVTSIDTPLELNLSFLQIQMVIYWREFLHP